MTASSDFYNERQKLLQILRRQGIHDPAVLEAIDHVPRELFIPESLRDSAYENRALAIGLDQTISQPFIVALMTQALELTGNERVLEIGTGSGYQAAILARLSQAVYTIERINELAASAKAVLTRLGIQNIEFRVGDGTLGWPEQAPFDRIIVTAAAPEIPEQLLAQLCDDPDKPGILVIPVGLTDSQTLISVRRSGNLFEQKKLCDCRFVPLIGEEGW